MSDDYVKYRGKCKEMSEALILNNPHLRLVRGHYIDHIWPDQPHWWCVDAEGNIIDPTKDQFPSKGTGEYVEFSGLATCEHCGKQVHEDDIRQTAGRHVYCSGECFYSAVCS